MDPISVGVGMGIPVYQMLKDLAAKLRAEKISPELLEAFQSVREQVVELHEQNFDLRERVTALEAERTTAESLEWDEKAGVYWRDMSGQKQATCPKCWAEKSKPIPMQRSGGGWRCLACATYCSASLR